MNEPLPYRPDGESTGSFPRSKPLHGRVDKLPQWRVILHDDEVHEPMEMIDLIASLLPITLYAAVRRVLETHHKGTSTLLLAHQELAELYYLQLSKLNLIVTIERE